MIFISKSFQIIIFIFIGLGLFCFVFYLTFLIICSHIVFISILGLLVLEFVGFLLLSNK